MPIIISVIIPTFKPDNYFNDCIYSLSNQNIDKTLFEIIIILNGPIQPYYNFINDVIKKHFADTRVTLIETLSSGVSNARNVGMEAAQGKYYCFIDDDDIITENYLTELLNNANETSITVSNVLSFRERCETTESDYLTRAFLRKNSKSNFATRKFLSNACCKLIPRTIIGQTRFNSSFSIGEDSIFMFEISNRIRSIQYTSENAIYFRRLREASASRSNKSKLQRIANSISLLREYSKIYFKKPFTYSFMIYTSRLVAAIKSLY